MFLSKCTSPRVNQVFQSTLYYLLIFISAERILHVDQKLLPLRDVVDVSESYEDDVQNLKEKVQERDIPSWILVPKRSSGENPSGYAWLGIVMSECSDEGDGVIDTRVAIDTDERDRVQSNVGKVPDSILNAVQDATRRTEEDIDICMARMKYDKSSMELQSVELYLRIEEEEVTEE